MEEIKVGEYVRTEDGYIIKYDDKDINTTIFDEGYIECCHLFIDTQEIVKHSPNIIDLIEVGDYVNGDKVRSIDRVDSEYGIVKCSNCNHYWNYEIKTILTKEQYEANCYEV